MNIIQNDNSNSGYQSRWCICFDEEPDNVSVPVIPETLYPA